MWLRQALNILERLIGEFYVEYVEQRKELDEIAEQIISLYKKYRVLDSVNVDFIRSWEKVKDKIVYRLVNKEQNKQMEDKK